MARKLWYFLVVSSIVLVFSLEADCASPHPQLHPIILIPGDGGSRVQAKLNKTHRVHYICSYTSDWFDLWLNLEQMVPEIVDCWVDNMKLKYNNKTHRTYDNDGVTTRIPGFGNTTTVEWLDRSQRSFSLYFANIVKHLLPLGYQRGVNIYGAPFDFRRAAHEHDEYFLKVKKLVEDAYESNGKTPVLLLCHSMGSPMMLYFLHRQTQAWKDVYIKSLVTLAGVWGGTARALKVFAVGDNLGAWLLNEKKLMWEQRTSSSLAWLMPQEGFWSDEEVLVQTEAKNYSRANFKEFFYDLSEPDGWMMQQDTKDLLPGLKPPGVEVFCIHGNGVNTTERLIYAKGEFPGKDPSTILKGDGDGTVNMRSLLGCTRWDGQQKQKVHHHILPGLDHLAVLKNDEAAEFVASLVNEANFQSWHQQYSRFEQEASVGRESQGFNEHRTDNDEEDDDERLPVIQVI